MWVLPPREGTIARILPPHLLPGHFGIMSRSAGSSALILPPNPRILVFDSGVGGLSIAREIQVQLPGVSLIYASDNAAFPYGTKAEDELIARVDRVIAALLAAYPVDLAVIACNTASTLTLPHLRQRFSLPFVGVVPAIKPAAEASQSRVIGLLATPATVARPYTHDLINTHASDCTVISLGSSELVQLAEQKLRGASISDKDITPITQALLNADGSRRMDHLVLACTHFPLLREELSRNLPERIQLIDSGAAIARRVKFLLDERQWQANPQQPGTHLAVFTKACDEIRRLQPALASFGIDEIAFVAP